MRRFIVAVAVFCLTPAVAVYSQGQQPPSGQPNGLRQQPAGQPGRPLPLSSALGAPGGQDAAFRQQVSYGLGRNFAMNLRNNEIECDLNALLAGISDALTGAQPKWTDDQLEATLKRFSDEMQQKAMTRMQQQASKNQQEADTFLAQNGKKPGVQTTPSGLQYVVVKQGTGPSPTLGDTVRCHYRGMLLNGTEFDSSAKRGKPAEFGLTRVIPGWTEALQKMKVGDKWQLYVPPKLAYGMDSPGPPIEPGSLLVFEIELLDIVKK